jgi:hypothetical protein
MQTQARPQHQQLVRIAGIAIAGSCAAVIAILLDWAPFSIGGASDNPVPARLSAISVQAATAREALADRAESTDTPTAPTCAELGGIASIEEPETFGEPRGAVGCDIMFGNLAADAPASSQSDVEAFLAWHLQARNLIQDAYQTGLWDIGER